VRTLINSEGHLRALEDYVKFLPNGSSEQIGWTLEQGWNVFLAGHAVMEPTWGDLPTLAQDRARSSVEAVGTGRVEKWENRGWDKADAIAYLNAYYANLVLPVQQIYLRFPGPQITGTSSISASLQY
jgi:hypothetical protein